jgi:hypothetical protein
VLTPPSGRLAARNTLEVERMDITGPTCEGTVRKVWLRAGAGA